MNFRNFKFLTVGTVKKVKLHHRAKFRQKRSKTAVEIWRFQLIRWQLSAILYLWCVCRDHPRKLFGGLYHCAKFGWNRCSSIDNMHAFRFCEFGLKTPIHIQKLFFWGVWLTKWGAMRQSASFEPSCVKIRRRVWFVGKFPKRYNKTCDGFIGIAISLILSKVFEHCILDRFGSFFDTADNQFGFKKVLLDAILLFVLSVIL